MKSDWMPHPPKPWEKTTSGKVEQRLTAPFLATMPGAVGVYWNVCSLSLVGYHTPTFNPPSCTTRKPTDSGALQLEGVGPGDGDGSVGVEDRLHPPHRSAAATRAMIDLTVRSYTPRR